MKMIKVLRKLISYNFSSQGRFGQGIAFCLVLLISSTAFAEAQKERPPTFGKHFPKFKEMCIQITEDGRGDEFNAIISKLADISVTECLGCKNFFRGFISSCRSGNSSKKGKKKEHKKESKEEEVHDEEHGEEEASPTPEPVVIKQKTPSFETIDVASSFAMELREDPKIEEPLKEIIERLDVSLKGSGEKGNEYFYTLSKYMTDPTLYGPVVKAE